MGFDPTPTRRGKNPGFAERHLGPTPSESLLKDHLALTEPEGTGPPKTPASCVHGGVAPYSISQYPNHIALRSFASRDRSLDPVVSSSRIADGELGQPSTP